MPEQPPDPLHYDMKIPPETEPEKKHAPDEPASDKNAPSDKVRDINVVRDDEKPQAGRHSQ